ncbi:MAG: type II secretion system protein M [Myxococcales bacterium]|nr:type II secretion system protein M [Myxococcales bacterium]
MAEKSRMQSLFDAFDRLSSREKIMVAGLGGAFFLTVVAVIALVFYNQITTLEQRNAATRDTLAEVMTLKDAYLAQKAKLDAKKDLLDRNDVKLVGVIEQEATRLGIEIEDFKEGKKALTDNARRARGRTDEGGEPVKVRDLMEVSQTVTLRRLSLEQLASLLAALEKRREPIKVTELNVQTLASDRQVLRMVKVTVSTYRNEEVRL